MLYIPSEPIVRFSKFVENSFLVELMYVELALSTLKNIRYFDVTLAGFVIN